MRHPAKSSRRSCISGRRSMASSAVDSSFLLAIATSRGGSTLAPAEVGERLLTWSWPPRSIRQPFADDAAPQHVVQVDDDDAAPPVEPGERRPMSFAASLTRRRERDFAAHSFGDQPRDPIAAQRSARARISKVSRTRQPTPGSFARACGRFRCRDGSRASRSRVATAAALRPNEDGARPPRKPRDRFRVGSVSATPLLRPARTLAGAGTRRRPIGLRPRRPSSHLRSASERRHHPPEWRRGDWPRHWVGQRGAPASDVEIGVSYYAAGPRHSSAAIVAR